jgi:hypothetical protein
MTEVLGYGRFGAHGGDIGAMVANRLALEYPERLVGIHVTRAAEPYLGPGAAPLTEAEQALLSARARWHEREGGYAHIQRTRPQTLAYGLTDSPVGLAAWIVEKWRGWSDCDGEVGRRFSKDQLLTTVMLYWVTGTIGSSFRFHQEWALGRPRTPRPGPVGPRCPPGWCGRSVGTNASRSRPRWPCSTTPVPGSGPNGPTATCGASPRCPAAATSRPWRNPSCWPRTCAGSSGLCGSWPQPVAWPQQIAPGRRRPLTLAVNGMPPVPACNHVP